MTTSISGCVTMPHYTTTAMIIPASVASPIQNVSVLKSISTLVQSRLLFMADCFFRMAAAILVFSPLIVN